MEASSQLSPLEERIFSRVYMAVPMPSAFSEVDVVLTEDDFDVLRNCPEIVWRKIRNAIGLVAIVDDFTIFQMIRTGQLEAYVLNYFLDRIDDDNGSPHLKFFKTVRMIHVLVKAVKEFPGYGGKKL